MWRMSQIGLKEEYFMLLKRGFLCDQHDLNLQTSLKVTAHPYTIAILWVKHEQEWINRDRRYASDKDFHIILLWPSHLTLALTSRSLQTLYSKSLFVWSMHEPNSQVESIYALKTGFLCNLIWPWPLTYKLCSRSLHTLRHFASKV